MSERTCSSCKWFDIEEDPDGIYSYCLRLDKSFEMDEDDFCSKHEEYKK